MRKANLTSCESESHCSSAWGKIANLVPRCNGLRLDMGQKWLVDLFRISHDPRKMWSMQSLKIVKIEVTLGTSNLHSSSGTLVDILPPRI